MSVLNSINSQSKGIIGLSTQGTINQATPSEHAIIYGGSTVSSLVALSHGTANEILQSGGAAAASSWTSYPQVSGLGIGASPGASSGLTFDSSSFLTAYKNRTSYTPTAYGSATAGTQSYSTQVGTYMQIGPLINVTFALIGTWGGTAAGVATVSLAVTAGAFNLNNYGCGYCEVNSTKYTGIWQSGSGNSFLNFLRSLTGTFVNVTASTNFNLQGSLWYYVL